MDVEKWDELKTNKFCNEIRTSTTASTVRCIELEKKNAELETQLASCRSAYTELTNSGAYRDSGEFVYVADQKLMGRFDKAFEICTAKANAEILRCAKEHYDYEQLVIQPDECSICEAVRAAREVE